MNNVKLMPVKDLEEELIEMEDAYSTAFMEETSAQKHKVMTMNMSFDTMNLKQAL